MKRIHLSLPALILACLMLCSGPTLRAQAPADSIDVLHYDVHLDTIVNTTAVKRIYAHTGVTLRAAQPGLTHVQLDLMTMQVDSVWRNGQSVAYTYNNNALRVAAPAGTQLGDTIRLQVWYQGRPHQDPSFGGFYFSGSNVFNIGVGFTSNPVHLGRVWIPSNDNFTDRANFDFHIRAGSGLIAACNGALDSTTTHPDGSATWHWHLRENIPVYLAGMSVAPYLRLRDWYVSINGDSIPFDIYGLASDTINAKNQSQNIKDGMLAFEQRFGRYRWQRLGYVIVAMPTSLTIGAMEHATNIVYPRVLLSLGQSYETIWAHEAAHAWFGNLVTTATEADMWLNEGWASYGECIFTEALYGNAAYKNYLRNTHQTVLRRARAEEGGIYQPLHGIPHAYVYGRTVYSKGMTMAHNLRYQLGDSLFFPAIQAYLNDHAFSHVSSDSLEKSLEQSSGIELTPFFDGWIKQGGTAHFRIDSFTVSNPAPYLVRVYTRQDLRGATALTDGTRAKIRFFDANLNSQDVDVVLNGATDTFAVLLPFVPVIASLDPEEHLLDATTDNYKFLTAISNQGFPDTWFNAAINTIADTSYLRVVHNWVAPDTLGSELPGIVLASERFWTIEGDFPAGFSAVGTFSYNGSNNATNGLVDNSWIIGVSEDSLVLLYRPGSGHPWALAAGQSLAAGSPADRVGNISAPLAAGEYAIGYRDGFVRRASPQAPSFTVWPNPNDGSFHVQLSAPVGKFRLVVTDMEGREVHGLDSEASTLDLQLQHLPAGTYLLRLLQDGSPISTERIVIQK
jgi:aminopeptidase N